MLYSLRMIVRTAVSVFFLTYAMSSVAQTHWPKTGWHVIDTNQNYEALQDNLRRAVVKHKMNVVFDVGPTEAAGKRGIKIPGNRVIGVFNNHFAVDILRLSVPAMIEAPIRFYVTERKDGYASLSWIEPSHIYASYIADMGNQTEALQLANKAKELDILFSAIAKDATRH